MSEPPELSDLVEELIDVKPQWFPFGLQLKIPFAKLKSIAKDCIGDIDVAFASMLEEWLKQEEPSWAAIVKALRSRTINQLRLADNLQDRFVAPANAATSPDRQLVPYVQTAQGASKSLAILIDTSV